MIFVCNVAVYVVLFSEYRELLIRYSKLCSTITDVEVNTLLVHFEQKRIIRPSDHQEIKATVKPNEKVQKLMTYILGTLEAGNTEVFCNVLTILEERGNQATRQLAGEMREHLGM